MTIPVVVSAIDQLPRDYVVPDELVRDLRRADAFIQMAVTSAFSAVSGLSLDKLHPEEIGVFIGTAFGPLETNFELLGSLIDDGEGQISPSLFSHSVFNAAAGYVARLLDIRGPAMTITNYGWPFLIALEEARTAVATGRVGRALVVGVETYSDLLADAYRRLYAVSEVVWQRSAVTWVLEPEGMGKGLCRLHHVSLRETDGDPIDFLTRKDEKFTGKGFDGKLARHPMAYAGALSRAVLEYRDPPDEQQTWSLEATFGRAEIILSG